MKFLSLNILLMLSTMAFSQAEFEVFDSEQIDVDGLYREKPRPSEADRLRQQRQQLEKANENLVRKKIEDARIEEERRMTERLKNMFNGNGFVADQVTTGAAAPAATSKAAAPTVNHESDTDRTMTVTLGAGFMGVFVDDQDYLANNDYNGQGFNLQLDGVVTNQIELGVGFGLSRLDFQENPFNFANQGFFGGTTFGFNRNRQIEGDILTVQFQGKFYLTEKPKFRPFVGGNLAYNRLSLEYTDQQNPFLNNGFGFPQNMEQEYTGNFMSAALTAGVQFNFTKSFGLTASGSYQMAFGGNDNQNQQFYNPFFGGGFNGYIDDQILLQNLGAQIEDASGYQINIGVNANF